MTTLLGHRRDTTWVGFERGHGAWVDWDALTAGPLSSTEIAMVRISGGCAVIERACGLPAHLVDAVTAVAAAL